MLGPLTCIICFNSASDPLTCQSCGPTYCRSCLVNFFQPGPMECIQCGSKTIGQMNPKILTELQGEGNKMVAEVTQQPPALVGKQEEMQFTNKSCLNHELCKSKCTTLYDEENACSAECYLLGSILPKLQSKSFAEVKKDIEEWLHTIQKKSLRNPQGPAGLNMGGPPVMPSLAQSASPFTFDHYAKAIQSNGFVVKLVEEQYVFRTALASKGFMSGVHYWEILPHHITENEIKVGVSKDKAFDLNTGFSDYKFGFAYYTVGSLRNGSNSTGKSYGVRFKNKGVLGVILDMNRGLLAFSFDGNDLGVAYQTPELKSGPIYPAVAMLHKAGFELRTGVPIPPAVSANYFR